jgi:hypothetical protein
MMTIGPVTVMRPARGRGYTMTTGGDVAFENRLCLPLDAQIDSGLFC